MTKTNETVQRVPFAKLSLAPENARFNSKDLGDVPALAASIVAVGDLIDPLKVYEEGGAFMVWDGGRRLAALTAITKDKKAQLPPALAAGVPVIVSDKDKAALLSRATFVREGLDAAEEFHNYTLLKAKGLGDDEIAAACGVSTPRVRQLLRLSNVAPPILDAFKAHKLPLDHVEAYSLSAEHEKQLSVFKTLGAKKGTSAWEIRQAFRQGALSADSFIAVFVGRDAYAAAGGTFLQDLFTGRDDEAWADRALAQQLAEKKMDELGESVKAEGWAWVATSEPHDYQYDRGMVQLPKPPGGKWAPEVMAEAGAFLKMRHNGTVDVQRGWKKAGKAQAAADAPKKPAQADPARFGYSHKGHAVLTTAATRATRVGLIRKPEVAYEAMLTHLAFLTFGECYTGDGVSRLNKETRWGSPPPVKVDGEDELDRTYQFFEKRLRPLAKDRVKFCEAIAEMMPDTKQALLALCFGLTLDGREDKVDQHHKSRWAHLGWIAARAEVDPAKAWTPSVEFLKGASRDALQDAAKQLGASKDTLDGKKAALAAFVAAKAQEKGWTPKLLASLTEVGEKPAKAPEKPKGGAKPKGAGKPQPAPEGAPPPATAEGDPEGDLSPALRALANGTAKPIGGEEPAAS